jgi:uncharacterized protein (TIGR02145 family)
MGFWMFNRILHRALLVTFLFNSISAGILRIPQDFATIQQGIDAAQTREDTVLVSPGTYFEHINFFGKEILLGSHFITTQDTMYISQTIIDGASTGTVVTFNSSESTLSRLSGLTIQNGFTSGDGGGVFIGANATPLLDNLVIQNSIAENKGGGVYSLGSPRMDFVKVVGNQAIHNGGGVYSETQMMIFRSVLSGNMAERGGAIYANSSNFGIYLTQIYENEASLEGGGIASMFSSVLTIASSSVVHNDATYGGGLFTEYSATTNIDNTIFYLNTPDQLKLTNQSIVNIEYSNCEGGESSISVDNQAVLNWNMGNFDLNPKFQSIIPIDLNLSWNSPCIDTGDPDPDDDGNNWGTDTGDQDPDGTRMDLGAIFFDQVNRTSFEIMGTLSINRSLSVDTIRVVGDITIDTAATLHIQPGVLVEFQDHYQILVNGTILATGTSSAPIRFDESNPGNGWNGLVYWSTPLTSDTSKFIHTEFLNGFAQPIGWPYDSGGAISVQDFGKIYISHCLFENNTVSSVGGAIMLNDAGMTIEDSEFRNNFATLHGGGIWSQRSNIILRRTTFYNNHAAGADGAGGAICQNNDLSMSIQNSTFVENVASYGGAIFGGEIELTNSIIWNNSNNNGQIYKNYGNAYVSYCDIDGGLDAVVGSVSIFQSNIDSDPLFVNQSIGNLSITDNSPCIDSGNPDLDNDGNNWNVDVDDQDPDGTRMDMGAYYYHHSLPVYDGPLWHVSLEGSDETGDGSEASPLSTIQYALNISENGDTILVQAGTYLENIIWPPTNGIKLIGSGESDCIIDGNQLASVIRFEQDISGIIDTNTIISGFSITNGRAQGDGPNFDGGGIYCYSSSPQFRNILINANTADNDGGGISCYESSPYLKDVTISDNIAYNGAGISCGYSNPYLTDVTIVGNAATYMGGGIFCSGLSTPNIVNSHISSNSADVHGGGIYCGDNANLSLESITINSNTANEEGGGIYISQANPTISRCSITNNEAITSGGGIYCDYFTNSFYYCEISDNSAANGAGIYVSNNTGTVPQFENCTIVNNTVTDNDDRSAISGIRGEIVNCIIWGNTGGEGAVSPPEEGYHTITYSDVQMAVTGIGNINNNPMFLNPVGSDYALIEGSPCIDAGDPTSPVDPDGTRADMGANYFDQLQEYSGPIWHVAPTGSDVSGDGSIGSPLSTIQVSINASQNGDTILVQPGTYSENINFSGKNIILGSLYLATSDTSYISTTIIDGGAFSSVVSIISGETEDCKLTGFTLRNGFSRDSDGMNNGYGGGICIRSYSDPILSNLIVENNQSQWEGGGIFIETSNPIIRNSIIRGNIGGGIASISVSAPLIEDCTIYGNTSEWGAGITIAGEGSNVDINRTMIRDNTATQYGAGLYASGSQNNPSTVNLINVTILNNEAINSSGGGILGAMYSEIEVVNTILWGNLPNQITQDHQSNIVNVSFSDVQGGQIGEGNINSDPLFQNDFGELSLISPCIDIADPDLDGDGELWENDPDDQDPDGTRMDMGAQYYHQTYFGPVWYIAVNGSDSTGNGSQEYPFASIQFGINVSDDGDTVFVQDGTYFENIDFYGKRIVLLSEGGSENTIIDGQSSSYVIRMQSLEDSTTVIDGFTIQNGNYGGGGGIICQNADPILQNLHIQNNVASNHGGGIIFHQSRAKLINVWINDNTAGGDGGGAYLYINSDVYFENVHIGNNTSSQEGGGIGIDNCQLELENCRIYDNYAPSKGGGIWAFDGHLTIGRSVIENNSTDDDGGGIACHYGTIVDIDASEVLGNIAATEGGGFYLYDNESISLSYTLIADNQASTNGGGMVIRGGNDSPYFQNLTITNNSATNAANILDNDNYFTTYQNCILWDISGSGVNISHDYEAEYSLTGGIGGVGNNLGNVATLVSSNPQFAYPDTGNYSLLSTSGCINTGNPDLDGDTYTWETDPDDQDPDGSRMDMGAYYFDHPNYYPQISISPDSMNFTVNTTESFELSQTLTISNTGTAPLDAEIHINSELVTDIDGNTYTTVEIGDQVWMAENLKVTHYRDGAAITNVTNRDAWSELITEGYCIYNNNESYEADTYGALYNWYAVDTTFNNVAPLGWHVPTDAEWTELETYLSNNGYDGSEGTALKSTTGWNTGNGTDDYGFTALPGGLRSYGGGLYMDLGVYAYFWSATESDNDNAWNRQLNYYDSGVVRSGYYKKNGYAIRCIRDGMNSLTSWLTTSPSTLTIPSGGSQEVTIGVNAEGLELGDYSDMITIISNDTTNSVLDIPVTMDVISTHSGPVWHVSAEGSDETGDGSEGSPFASIQFGIDATENGDTVLVQPGTYTESIDFGGKNIVLSSLFMNDSDTSYISQTVIDAGGDSSVVKFVSGEGSMAILNGFSITGGYGSDIGGTRYGGGIYCDGSSPSILFCKMYGNDAHLGGGIACFNNSNPSIEDCVISSNIGHGAGAGLACDHSSPLIIRCIIQANHENGWNGGGIHCEHDSNPSIISTLISGNSAGRHGGGIYTYGGSNPLILNSTISTNTAGLEGGAVHVIAGSHPVIMNSILWDNNPQEISFMDGWDPNELTISYSDVDGGLDGIITHDNGTVNWDIGNIDLDPLFNSIDDNDYGLTAGSPCIDAGNPNLDGDSDTWETDPDDQDPDGTRMDVGAYYFDQSHNTIDFGKILLFGQGQQIGNDNAAYSYDTNTDTWAELTSFPDPTLEFHDNAMAYDVESDRIILFGNGQQIGNDNAAYSYDTNTDTWAELTSFPDPTIEFHDNAMAYDVESDRIILFGKGQQIGNENAAYSYDTNTDTWIELTSFPDPTVEFDNNAMAYLGVIEQSYSGPTWHVSTAGSDDAGDGSYESPFASIQAGVYHSSNGDTILVQPGSYVEDINFLDKSIVVGSQYLSTGDTSYVSSTIIDGMVRIEAGVDSSALFSGFTIQSGSYGILCHGDPIISHVKIMGATLGGIYFSDANATLMYSIISGNTRGVRLLTSDVFISNTTISLNGGPTSTGNGVGTYSYNSSVRFDSCTIVDNHTSGVGGGVRLLNSSASISNSNISRNSALSGGGVYCDGGTSLVLDGVAINSNQVDGDGGGLYTETNGTSVLATNSQFNNNISGENGGGIYSESSLGFHLYNHCSIQGNTASVSGGGIYLWGSSPILTNVLITDNEAAGVEGTYEGGGGIYVRSVATNPTFNNTTIANNYAVGNGGGIFNLGGAHPEFTNTIIYHNAPNSFNSINGTETSYCDIEGGLTGGGSINTDPLFVDMNNGDYHLSDTSPCIDTANPDGDGDGDIWDVDQDDQDPDGTRMDMGAYYYHQMQIHDGPFWHVATDGSDDTGDGSIDSPYLTIQYAVSSCSQADTVLLHPGNYSLEAPVEFPDFPISIISSDGIDSTKIIGSSNVALLSTTTSSISLSRFGGITFEGFRNVAQGVQYLPRFSECKFSDNPYYQQGLFNLQYSDSVAQFDNCVFVQNTAVDFATNGFFTGTQIQVNFTNCSFAQNGSGILTTYMGQIHFENCILRSSLGTPNQTGETASYSFIEYPSEFGNPGLMYECIDGQVQGSPGFVDEAAGNLMLLPNSICIDVGNPDLDGDGDTWETDSDDQDPDGTRMDMGAYYHHQELSYNGLIWHVSIEGSDETGDGSEGSPFATIQFGIDASLSGDTVLVQPGTFVETINYNGKNIVLGSLTLISEDDSYIGQTIIDGDHAGSVITIGLAEDSTTVLHGFTIRNGQGLNGGGINCYNASPQIVNCRISGNTATSYGGGLCFDVNSKALIENCLIDDNNATLGGGIFCEINSDIKITDVTIRGNVATNIGGGFYCTAANPLFTRVLIEGNSALYSGGVYFHGTEDAETFMNNVTIVNNTADSGGALLVSHASTILTANSCVIWGNSPSQVQVDGGDLTFAINYSDIQNGWEGEGNLDEDPLFVDAENRDYHLDSESPCIDTGDPNAPFDPDGTIADMGAYYFDQPNYYPQISIGADSLSFTVNKAESFELSQTLTISNTGTAPLDVEIHINSELVTDIDGNIYPIIQIGDQVWMAENLNVTHYRDGSTITNVVDAATWETLTTEAFCVLENNTSNENDTYGNLYNWYAAVDERNIAPEGWHVPTDLEWKELEMALGMSQSDAGAPGWRGSNEGSKLAGDADLWANGLLVNNSEFGSSGFSALPGGSRTSIFNIPGHNVYFWSATEDGVNYAWSRSLNAGESAIKRSRYSESWGFSIRCIKDSDVHRVDNSEKISDDAPNGNYGIQNEEDPNTEVRRDTHVSWITISPILLNIQPGTSADVTVTVNAEGLELDEYSELISINSNDPLNSIIEVPVTMNVIFQDLIPPEVQLDNPDISGGLENGDTLSVTWTASDNVAVDWAKLFFTSDGGTSFSMYDSVDASMGQIEWIAPDVISNTCNFAIWVSDSVGNISADTLDGFFAITDGTAPQIAILTPIQTTSVREHDSLFVSWTASDNIAIEWYELWYANKPSDPFENIAQISDGDTTFAFKIGEGVSDSTTVKIIVTDVAGNTAEDVSGYFSVTDNTQPNILSFSIPDTTEWGIGSFLDISVVAMDNVEVIGLDIYYTIDAGESWSPVVVDLYPVQALPTYSWLIPDIPGDCQLQAIITDGVGLTDTSYSDIFSIFVVYPQIVENLPEIRPDGDLLIRFSQIMDSLDIPTATQVWGSVHGEYEIEGSLDGYDLIISSPDGFVSMDTIELILQSSGWTNSFGYGLDGNGNGIYEANGIDNDTSYILVTAAGDFDQNGVLNFDDFDDFVLAWSNDDSEYELYPHQGDIPFINIQADSSFDVFDLATFASMWNWAAGVSLAAPLTESYQYEEFLSEQSGNELEVLLPLSDLLASQTIIKYDPEEVQVSVADNGLAKVSSSGLSLVDVNPDSGFILITSSHLNDSDDDGGLHLKLIPETRQRYSIEIAFQGSDMDANVIQKRSLVELLPIPTSYSLSQNYPNPFNASTTIEYGLPSNTELNISIYDIRGRFVREIYSGDQLAGYHFTRWNAENAQGQNVASGLYFIVLNTPEFRVARKALILK